MLYKLDIFLYDRFQQRNSTKNNISKLLNERKRFMTIKRDNTPGLYDSSFEHDNCGIGACVNIKGIKSHTTVDNALKIVETLEHRA